jgi:hypothetical protein
MTDTTITTDDNVSKFLAALSASQEALKAYRTETSMTEAQLAEAEAKGELLSSEDVSALEEKGYEAATRAAQLLGKMYPDAPDALVQMLIRWTKVDFRNLLFQAVSYDPELRDTLLDVADETEPV